MARPFYFNWKYHSNYSDNGIVFIRINQLGFNWLKFSSRTRDAVQGSDIFAPTVRVQGL